MSPQPAAPVHWTHGTATVDLSAAILEYIETNEPITGVLLEEIRAYFEQWIALGDWRLEPDARQDLLDWARTLKGRLDIGLWLAAAEHQGIGDPL